MLEACDQIGGFGGIHDGVLYVIVPLVHISLDADQTVSELFEESLSNLAAGAQAQGALADVFVVPVHLAFHLPVAQLNSRYLSEGCKDTGKVVHGVEQAADIKELLDDF